MALSLIPEAQKALETLHKYWTIQYPSQILIINNQLEIVDKSGYCKQLVVVQQAE